MCSNLKSWHLGLSNSFWMMKKKKKNTEKIFKNQKKVDKRLNIKTKERETEK